MANLADLKKGTIPWYEQAYRDMEFDPGFDACIIRETNIVANGMTRYKALEAATGVPAELIGSLHNMECSCDFRGYLGNGDLIIGNGKLSVDVPAGRGPFETWEDGAIDALNFDGLTSMKSWSIGLELMLAERFNGMGYLKYHTQHNSPYLWACTTINDGHGKYVKDGVWDENAPTTGQIGVAAVYKQLEKMGLIQIRYST